MRPTPGANTAAQFMGQYKNPYEQQVVDTTLAGYDRNAAEQAAQMQAQAAKAGAFGGSRFGIAQGQFAADNALNRARPRRSFARRVRQGLGLGATDAGAFNQASLFNAGNQTGVSLANAGGGQPRARTRPGSTPISASPTWDRTERSGAVWGRGAEQRLGWQPGRVQPILPRPGRDAERRGPLCRRREQRQHARLSRPRGSGGAIGRRPAQNAASLFNAQQQRPG
jgi:hypothetical protein